MLSQKFKHTAWLEPTLEEEQKKKKKKKKIVECSLKLRWRNNDPHIVALMSLTGVLRFCLKSHCCFSRQAALLSRMWGEEERVEIQAVVLLGHSRCLCVQPTAVLFM